VNELSQDTILVVDDEPTVLSFCKLVLTRGGFHVVDARNGPEALRLARAAGTRISLAMLDVVMPGMNGFELAAQLRRIDPDLQVLMMSGYSVNEVRNIAGGDDSYRVIWKPFKAESMVRMVQTVLDDAARNRG
jgi:two-component system cell cycle sensor histidine kinase/response regulator CckA